MSNQTQFTEIKIEYSEEELNQMAVDVADKIKAFYALEAEKKMAMMAFNADLSVIKKEILELNSERTLGFYFDKKECRIENDYINNVRFFKDIETGVILKEEEIEDAGLFENVEILEPELSERDLHEYDSDELDLLEIDMKIA